LTGVIRKLFLDCESVEPVGYLWIWWMCCYVNSL